MSELKEIAAKAAELLPGAFIWTDTPQGQNYWVQVYLDLLKLAEVGDHGLYFLSSGEVDSWPRSNAPLAHETDRKFALEVADLIDDLLLYFMAPVLADNDPFLRWAAVQEDLFELGGVTGMEEGQIPTRAEFEEDR